MSGELRVAVLGCRRGLSVARLFDALDEATVVAACDGIPARKQAALAALPSAEGFDDYEAMLSRKPDVVVVASSPSQHVEHTRMALEMGAAVLSEVPAAASLEDAQELVDAVERTGGFYMFGENCNYYGYIREWKRLICEGVLGEPIHAEGEYVHDIRGNTWVGADGTLYTPQDAPPDATPRWRAGYDPIYYITHSLGPLLWLLGERCTTVSCLSSGVRTDPVINSPDMQVAIFNTTGGVPIRQLVGFSLPHEPGGQWFSLYTTRGCVEWKRAGWDKPKIFLEGQETRDKTTADWPMALESPLADSGHGGIDGAMVWDFVGALLDGKPSPIDVHAGLDCTLPGIYGKMSVDRGGEMLRIPDTRTERLV